MISLVPRSAAPDAPPPAVALGLSVAAEATRAQRLKPVEPGEPTTAIRREKEKAEASARASAEKARALPAAGTVEPLETQALQPSVAWSLLSLTPFMAQLIGQEAHQGDQWLNARGLTSFRKSPIVLYEQTHGRARRIEFLIELEDRVIPATA